MKVTSIIKYLFLFLFGGASYNLIEILWRGHTHWTMFILGGLCFVLVGLINNLFSWDMFIEIQSLIGAIIITIAEFITGIIVNIILQWNVWDYSNILFNIKGQICLPFSILWYLISFLVIFLDDFIRYKFFKEQKPTYISIFKR